MSFSTTITEQQLDGIARRASDLFMSGDGGSATESVVKAASGTDGMTDQHVRRVCEKTYREVFERMHKSASGDRNVVFDPPDAKVAARMLMASKVASAKVAHAAKTAGAPTTKEASAPPPKRFTPANIFDEVTKQAEDIVPVRGIADLKVAWRDLRHAVDTLETQKSASDTQTQIRLIELMDVVKLAAVDATADEIVLASMEGTSALRPDIPEEDLTKAAELLVHGLVRIKARFAEDGKVASDVRVDTGHPVVVAFSKLAEALLEQRTYEIGLETVRSEYARASEGLRVVSAA